MVSHIVVSLPPRNITFPAITYRLAHHSLVEFQWNVPRILSTAEKYARDVKDKDVFRGGSCDKYYKKKYLTSKKEFLRVKEKKRTESIRFPLPSRSNGIARNFKKEFSLHFYSPRVYRMTSSVKTSRDTLHRGSAHAEKNDIYSYGSRRLLADHSWNNVSTIVTWIR